MLLSFGTDVKACAMELTSHKAAAAFPNRDGIWMEVLLVVDVVVSLVTKHCEFTKEKKGKRDVERTVVVVIVVARTRRGMLLEVTHVLLVGFAMVLMSPAFSFSQTLVDRSTRTCSEICW